MKQRKLRKLTLSFGAHTKREHARTTVNSLLSGRYNLLILEEATEQAPDKIRIMNQAVMDAIREKAKARRDRYSTLDDIPPTLDYYESIIAAAAEVKVPLWVLEHINTSDGPLKHFTLLWVAHSNLLGVRSAILKDRDLEAADEYARTYLGMSTVSLIERNRVVLGNLRTMISDMEQFFGQRQNKDLRKCFGRLPKDLFALFRQGLLHLTLESPIREIVGGECEVEVALDSEHLSPASRALVRLTQDLSLTVEEVEAAITDEDVSAVIFTNVFPSCPPLEDGHELDRIQFEIYEQIGGHEGVRDILRVALAGSGHVLESINGEMKKRLGDGYKRYF